MLLDLIAGAIVAAWVYLIAARGLFWMTSERDEDGPAPANWPQVTAVIPARDEAQGVSETVGSLLRQDYPGSLAIVLVDDQSTDGTADVARRAAAEAGAADRLTVLPGTALPPGWTGKLWAMYQGIQHVGAGEYLLLTDADIVYERDALIRLVSKAAAENLVLNSWMVKLRCQSIAERALI